MYPEFIAIYIGLIILIALAVLIFLKLKKLSNKLDNGANYNAQSMYDMPNSYNTPNLYHSNANVQGQVVFCRSCATQFDASSPYCPACGAPR